MFAWWDSFVEFIHGLWLDFVEFIKDIFLFVFELLLNGIATVFEVIPVPQFVSDGLQSIVNQLPQGVLYAMGQTGFTEGMGILALGYTFRLIRKFVTLFQW